MRKKNGYALITILVIGLFAIAFLLVLAEIVTSAVRVVSANKWAESLRNAAEIGIDYAVNQYNCVPGGLDSADPNTATSATTLDPSLLQSVGIPNVTVTITSTRLLKADAQDWTKLQTSSLYRRELDPNSPISEVDYSPISSNSPAGGGYRIITSTASNGVYSKAIRVVLVAQFDIPPDQNALLTPDGVGRQAVGGGGTSPQSSVFTTPFLSNGAITLSSSALTVQGYNSQTGLPNPVHTMVNAQGNYAAYDLNVTTNTLAQIGANNIIAGDLTVLGNNANNPVVQVDGTVNGRLVSNGFIPNTVEVPPSGPAPQNSASDGNVLANADAVASNNPSAPRQGFNATGPSIVNNPVAAQSQIAPTPSEGPVLAGQSAPQPMQPLASLSSLSEQGAAISAYNPSLGTSGNYVMSGLTTDNVSAPVSIQNATLPVAFFVQDSGAGQGVNINTASIASQNTDARNLQIYYQGSSPVTINVNGNDFTGLVYAPNAPVTISGSGNFNGGIVGNTVVATLAGTMNLYTDLSVTSPTAKPSGWTNTMDGAANAYSANNISMPLSTSYNHGTLIQGWQPVTWQEFNP